MEVSLKNIILYDPRGAVSGFAEIKFQREVTSIKVRHNFDDKDLLFSLVADGNQSHIFELQGSESRIEIRGKIDLSAEVFVCVITRKAGDLVTLASGVINPASQKSTRPIAQQTAAIEKPATSMTLNEPAVREVDEILRNICTIDEQGKGVCESCPYRDYFFEFTLDREQNARKTNF